MKRLNENDLLDAIGGIDEKYIAESEKAFLFTAAAKYSGAIAACLAFVLISGIALYSAARREEPVDPPKIVYTSSNESSDTETTLTDSTTHGVSSNVSLSSSEDTVTETTLPVIPSIPVTQPEPTEPDVQSTEPIEDVESSDSTVPVTGDNTSNYTDTPVYPFDPETSEPVEIHPPTDSTTDLVITTIVGPATNSDITETDSWDTTQYSTDIFTSGASVTCEPDETTSASTGSSGGSYIDKAPDHDPDLEWTEADAEEYKKYYTGPAPTTGSFGNVTAHYLTEIPQKFCEPLFMCGYCQESDVYKRSTDIFSGMIVGLRSVALCIDGKYEYGTVLELKVTDGIFRSSGGLKENSTVRVYLSHGVNTTDEGLYEAEDIMGLLGEKDLINQGSGIFCVTTFHDDKRYSDDREAYYSLSAIADYYLLDGMNDLIISNGYHTFYNDKTYKRIAKGFGSSPFFADVVDYFNKLKVNGIL